MLGKQRGEDEYQREESGDVVKTMQEHCLKNELSCQEFDLVECCDEPSSMCKAHMTEPSEREVQAEEIERGGGQTRETLLLRQESVQQNDRCMIAGEESLLERGENDVRENDVAVFEAGKICRSGVNIKGMMRQVDDEKDKDEPESQETVEQTLNHPDVESSRHLYTNGVLTIKRLGLALRFQTNGYLMVLCEEEGIFSQTLEHGDEIQEVNSITVVGRSLTEVVDLFHECIVCVLLRRCGSSSRQPGESKEEVHLIEIASPFTLTDTRDICRRRLISFYKIFNPQKLRYVNDILDQTGLNVVNLNASLLSKYNADLDSDFCTISSQKNALKSAFHGFDHEAFRADLVNILGALFLVDTPRLARTDR